MFARIFQFSTLLLSLLLSNCALPGKQTFDPHAEIPLDPATAAITKNAEPLPTTAFSTTVTTQPMQRDWLLPPTGDYLLGPGDKVEIEVFGEDDTRETTFVTPDGKLYYSLVPGLNVLGKSIQQVKKELQTALQHLYKEPVIGLTLTDAISQRVWVLGRVNGPGNFPLKRPVRVLEAIAMAGGLSTSDMNGTTEELADLEHSFLKRNNQLMPVDFKKLLRDGDQSQNIYVQPNDFIYLPSSLNSEVYVLGNVAHPRPVGFRNEMTLLSAYSQAQGGKPGADLRRVIIIRGSLTQPQFARVNLAAIMAGRARDVRLQPGDIIYLPNPGVLDPMTYVSAAMDTFTRAIGASDGPHDYPSSLVNTAFGATAGATAGRLVGESFPTKQ